MIVRAKLTQCIVYVVVISSVNKAAMVPEVPQLPQINLQSYVGPARSISVPNDDCLGSKMLITFMAGVYVVAPRVGFVNYRNDYSEMMVALGWAATMKLLGLPYVAAKMTRIARWFDYQAECFIEGER